jgi:hypothetical protein
MAPRTCADRRRAGFGTLLSVLIIGAAGVVTALSVLWSGLGSSRTSFSREKSFQAKALADACMEEALQQLRDEPGIVGTQALPLGLGDCGFTALKTGATAKTVTASATSGSAVRKVKATLDPFVPPASAAWQERGDF